MCLILYKVFKRSTPALTGWCYFSSRYVGLHHARSTDKQMMSWCPKAEGWEKKYFLSFLQSLTFPDPKISIGKRPIDPFQPGFRIIDCAQYVKRSWSKLTCLNR